MNCNIVIPLIGKYTGIGKEYAPSVVLALLDSQRGGDDAIIMVGDIVLNLLYKQFLSEDLDLVHIFPMIFI